MPLWSSWRFWTCILLPRDPVSGSTTSKLVIWYKMQPLWLDVKLIIVPITCTNNAKMIFERSRFLRSGLLPVEKVLANLRRREKLWYEFMWHIYLNATFLFSFLLLCVALRCVAQTELPPARTRWNKSSEMLTGPNEWPVSTAIEDVESPMMSQVSYRLAFKCCYLNMFSWWRHFCN